MDDKNQHPSTYPKLKIIIPLFLGVVLILFISVYLFTSDSFISGYNLANKGAIGDAINGITAPIISLIAAALIFYSFLSQIEANKIQMKANQMLQSQWQFDTYYRLYNEIENSYKALSITITTKSVNKETSVTAYEGHDYIRYLIDKIDLPEPYVAAGWLSSIDFMLEDMIALINYVNTSNVAQKEFFLKRIERFYSFYLEESLMELTNCLDKNEKYFSRYLNIYSNTEEAISKIRLELSKT
ncbi:MAG: hypothetical protein J0L69_12965 [Bacteroidetes bacterium]|nr:hypothetical protein [Bacteroidota bacterium]